MNKKTPQPKITANSHQSVRNFPLPQTVKTPPQASNYFRSQLLFFIGGRNSPDFALYSPNYSPLAPPKNSPIRPTRVTIYAGCEHPVSVPAFVNPPAVVPLIGSSRAVAIRPADLVSMVNTSGRWSALSFNQFFSPTRTTKFLLEV